MLNKEMLSFPLLSREEEEKALKNAQVARGITRKNAKNSLVTSNLRLVTKIAHEYKTLGLPLEDLVNEGSIGLMRAIEKFNPEKKVKFSYYASMWIRQSISRALSNKSKIIRIPHGLVNEKSRLLKSVTKLTEKLGRAPTPQELSKDCDLTEKKIKKIQNFLPSTISLHQTVVNDDGECNLENILTDSKQKDIVSQLITKENLSSLKKLLSRLPKREHYILEHRFGLGNNKKQTLETIGKKFNLTRERIRQIEKESIKKLKKMFDKT